MSVGHGPWVVEYTQPGLLLQYGQNVEETLGIHAEDAVVDPAKDETCLVLLSNPTGFTRHLEAREYLGEAQRRQGI